MFTKEDMKQFLENHGAAAEAILRKKPMILLLLQEDLSLHAIDGLRESEFKEDHEIERFAKEIVERNFKYYTHILDLEKMHLSNGAIEELIAFIQSNRTITEILFPRKLIHKQSHLEALTNAILMSPSLLTLKGFYDLNGSIRKHCSKNNERNEQNLRKISQNLFGYLFKRGIQRISDNDPTLTSFEIKYDKFGKDVHLILEFFSALSANTYVNHVKFENEFNTNVCYDVIYYALENNTTLMELDIFGDGGSTRRIEEILNRNNHQRALRVLEGKENSETLVLCKTTTKQMKEISEHFRQNKTVREIMFRGPGITASSESIAEFSDIIMNSWRILKINFSGNYSGDMPDANVTIAFFETIEANIIGHMKRDIRLTLLQDNCEINQKVWDGVKIFQTIEEYFSQYSENDSRNSELGMNFSSDFVRKMILPYVLSHFAENVQRIEEPENENKGDYDSLVSPFSAKSKSIMHELLIQYTDEINSDTFYHWCKKGFPLESTEFQSDDKEKSDDKENNIRDTEQLLTDSSKTITFEIAEDEDPAPASAPATATATATASASASR